MAKKRKKKKPKFKSKKKKKEMDLTKYDIDKLLKKEGFLKESRKKISSKAVLFLIGLLVMIIIAALLYLMPAKEEIKICRTDSCLIDAANECTPAVLEKTISTVKMRLEVKEGCVLNKKVTDMDKTEPKEVRDLFIGAEMDCNYDMGNFDENYVTQISGNLGFCSGTLVDAILAVL